MYFDGSDVNLNRTDENVYGVWLHSNGDLYLTTRSNFSVTGLSGDKDDIFIFTPDTLGSNTSGSFSAFWDSAMNGFANERIDGLFLQ